MVDQGLFEVVCAVSPVLLQIEAQVTCGHLPGSIADVAGPLQVTHDRVDDRHPCHAGLPPLDEVFVIPPFAIHTAGVPVLEEDIVAELVRPVVPEVAPKQLGNEVRRVLVGLVLRLPRLDLEVDLPRRQAPVGHPGRELRRKVGPEEAIPLLLVVAHALVFPQVLLEASEARVLSSEERQSGPVISVDKLIFLEAELIESGQELSAIYDGLGQAIFRRERQLAFSRALDDRPDLGALRLADEVAVDVSGVLWRLLHVLVVVDCAAPASHDIDLVFLQGLLDRRLLLHFLVADLLLVE